MSPEADCLALSWGFGGGRVFQGISRLRGGDLGIWGCRGLGSKTLGSGLQGRLLLVALVSEIDQQRAIGD